MSDAYPGCGAAKFQEKVRQTFFDVRFLPCNISKESLIFQAQGCNTNFAHYVSSKAGCYLLLYIHKRKSGLYS